MFGWITIIVMFVLAWTGWIVPVVVSMIYILPVLFIAIAVAEVSCPVPRRKHRP
jgi:ABC-type antimicrobial peptide transport system permease subunit